jgi:hypothetical protein
MKSQGGCGVSAAQVPFEVQRRFWRIVRLMIALRLKIAQPGVLWLVLEVMSWKFVERPSGRFQECLDETYHRRR